MIYPVILAGGVGSRLWPLSRQHYPKQFLPLLGDKTLFEQTVSRLASLEWHAGAVICNEAHRFLAAEQLRLVGDSDHMGVILEPVGRSTAPAIALAALKAMVDGEDPNLLVMPADHFIGDVSKFSAAIERAAALADEGHLVTFGVEPRYAETGYGYIRRGEVIEGGGYRVDAFVEKPSENKAQAFIRCGDHYWNGGLFLFRASAYLDALQAHRPSMLAICRQAMDGATQDHDFLRPDAECFARCPDESIDYAVMEHTDRAAVVPLDAHWSDVGSWQSLWALQTQDVEGNAHCGDVVMDDCRNTYVHGAERLVCTLGLDDVVVVDTKDAVLVAHRDSAPQIGQFVKKLKVKGRSEVDFHRVVYRPWGCYDSVDQGGRHQVKRITVKPGAKLSVQMHHHRAEHWVVVSGTARVFNGNESYLVTENESTYIPVGRVHALENPGSIDLQLIEVQSGSYLGEDDIVRFEDRYGRS